MLKNTSKVALVTGGARRIGAAIARILHENGFNIALHYHQSEKEAAELRAELNKIREGSAVALCADLREIKKLAPLVEKAAAEWGRLDVLVNNASRFYKTEVGKTTEEAWDDLFDSNLKSPFFLSQAAAPHLIKNEGSIVNIADIHSERPMRDYPVYCISKAGLVMMTEALARELGPLVRVNAVSPGAVAWPEGANTLSPELKNEIINRVVLRRHGDPADIAKTVLFLVRDAGYVTGQVIKVDGGRSIFI